MLIDLSTRFGTRLCQITDKPGNQKAEAAVVYYRKAKTMF
jgi:hypothetical protein